jgi:hypothetical protein
LEGPVERSVSSSNNYLEGDNDAETVNVIGRAKVKFTLEWAMKAQRESRIIALLFL